MASEERSKERRARGASPIAHVVAFGLGVLVTLATQWVDAAFLRDLGPPSAGLPAAFFPLAAFVVLFIVAYIVARALTGRLSRAVLVLEVVAGAVLTWLIIVAMGGTVVSA